MQEITTKVLAEMQDIIDIESLEFLSYTLNVVLSDYDIEKKCTELSVCEMSWKTILNDFLITKTIEGKSEKTITRYAFELGKLLTTIGKDLNDIKSSDILKYLGIQKKTRGVSNKTLDNERLVYSSFFTWLHNRAIISVNPIATISKIKAETKVLLPFSDEDRQKIYDACENDREKALVEFLYSTCVRVDELINIKITDIDFKENEVVVHGKGNKQRKVYINARSKMFLETYLVNRKGENVYLFTASKYPYNNLTTHSIRSILKQIEVRSGVKDVHPHRFRRTGATNALARGMPLQEVSRMLGHAKLETTMIYCSINQEQVKTDHKKYLSY